MDYSPPGASAHCGASSYTKKWGVVGWEQKEELGSKKTNLEEKFRRHAPPNAVGDEVGLLNSEKQSPFEMSGRQLDTILVSFLPFFFLS